MNKKILLLIGILIFAEFSVGWQDRTKDRSILKQRFREFKQEFKEKKARGYDVSEAKNLIRQAKEAHQKGDKKEVRRLLKDASDILKNAHRIVEIEKTKIFAVPETVEEKTNKRLPDVKVAVLYQNINDGVLIGRSVNETIGILKETKADLIFRGFWKWTPVVDSPDNIPLQLLDLAPEGTTFEQAANGLRRSGHYYEELKRWISTIKKELPDIIFVGAVPAQILSRIEYNPITNKVYSEEETWAMALDPQKWNITRNGKHVTKKEFQAWFYGVHPYGGVEEKYDPGKANAYFPDITNPEFQELLLSWAEKQIDCGADGIWIDMLYHQAARLAQITGDVNHPAVKDSIAAAIKIVDKIHKYGKSKGRYIYVGSWESPFVRAQALKGVRFSYKPASLDFITVSPDNKEVLDRSLNTERWKKEISLIKEAYGAIPIFAFIDWSFDKSPMVMFSQRLNKEEQSELLKMLDNSFAKMGVNFIYPIHGGYMGRGEVTTKLAFGKYRFYDSLVPEFQTYETIKELALKKAGEDETVCGNQICESGEDGNNCSEDCCVSGDGKCPAGCSSKNDNDCKIQEVKVETICTDRIDNDGDGLTDNDDGDCWIKEGPIYETHPYYYPNHSFKEITKQIPHLADLGVKTIYLMPVWEHKGKATLAVYSIYDYYKIDPEFGTEEDLKELVDAAHRYDMRIIFDLVTCCTPKESVISNNNWTFKIPLTELQSRGLNLEYDSYEGDRFVYFNCEFKGRMPTMCDLFGRIVGDDVMMYHYRHASWGHAIDKTNPELINYLTEVAVYYVREYDIDGWRIDAPQNNWNPEIISGDHSIVKLLRSVKKAITDIKPDAVLLSESPYLTPLTAEEIPDPSLDEMCEASYSFYCHYKFSDLDTSEQLIGLLKDEKIRYDRTRTRFLESHDTPRVNEIRLLLNKPYIVLISTIPGVPWLQAGQEIGAKNPAKSANPQVDWSNGDYELRDFYKKVFEIRSNNNALKYGDIEDALLSPKVKGLIAYNRWDENESATVVVNLNDKPITAILNTLFEDNAVIKDELSGETFTITDPENFRMSVPAYDSRILILK